MNDVLLACFRAATETLNFTTAAQMVHISQPSFSRNIAMLEDELGFKLFWRSKQNGIRLTPAGATLYEGLTGIEAQFKVLLEKSRRISRGEEGKLVIGILNGICLDSQSFYQIQKFQQQYPQVSVELKSCTLRELETTLLTGVCDICFLMADVIKEKSEILCEVVYKIPSYFVVPRAAGFEQGGEYRMEDLKDQVFLLSEDFPEINEHILEGCRLSGFTPKTKMAPDHETKMLWAEMGAGVTGVTKDFYVVNSEQVNLIRIKEVMDMDYSIGWSKDNFNPAIALFYSIISEIATPRA